MYFSSTSPNQGKLKMEWWFGKTKYIMTTTTVDAAAAGTSSPSCREAARLDSDEMLINKVIIQGNISSCKEADQMFNNEIQGGGSSSSRLPAEAAGVLVAESDQMFKYEIENGVTSAGAVKSSADMLINSTETVEANFCGICMEEKETEEMFMNPKCPHTFCSYCISQHIESKIEELVIMVTCPELDCAATLEPHICKGMIQAQLFDRWCSTLCESLFLGPQRLYCPYKDCSAMLVFDPDLVIREAECLHCRRLFCAKCSVPWHGEIHCEEFQKLNKDEREVEDLMLMNLAKSRKWKRCPSCKYYVEKSDGCLHMICRCKYELCYRCGEQWNEEDHNFCS